MNLKNIIGKLNKKSEDKTAKENSNSKGIDELIEELGVLSDDNMNDLLDTEEAEEVIDYE